MGDRGQAALGRAAVSVEGDGADAQIAVRYLAGAGVGRLAVHPRWLDEARACNSTIAVEGTAASGELAIVVGAARHAPSPEIEGAVARGAHAARWAIARVLST